LRSLNKIAKLANEIIKIKTSTEYRTLKEIKDWNSCFSSVKEQINQEVEQLQSEIKSMD